jgi:hypothetical protein
VESNDENDGDDDDENNWLSIAGDEKRKAKELKE